jgi:arsenate reductase-like glutaredoxin family protein
MKQHPPARQEALELMSAHPNLIRRPLIVEAGRVWFGFKPEEWGEIGKS